MIIIVAVAALATITKEESRVAEKYKAKYFCGSTRKWPKAHFS